MHALLISEVFPPRVGGSGRWLLETYTRFPRNEFTLAVGQTPGDVPFDRGLDATVLRLPLSFSNIGLSSPRGLAAYWSRFRTLQQLVRGGRYDQIHAGRCLPEGWLALLLSRWYGLPFICHVYGEEVNLLNREGHAGLMASRQLRWMTRAVLFGARLVVAISRSTQRILVDQWGLPAERIHLVHPGVDTNRFVPAERDTAIRERLGWADRRVVLTVGRLQRRKGQDQLIQALGRVRMRLPDVLYAIVGSGEDEPRLRELVRTYGLGDHVQFLGEVDDDTLVRCYQQCDLFALPNRQDGRDIEGFGMVLLEAQACGRPVIAGASGGTADTMRTSETGYLVACETPEPLADALAELLADRNRLDRMGLAARRWSVDHFDWSAVSRHAYAVFASVSRIV